jgi:hypothetical protein
MTISTLSVPFKGAKDIHAFTLQALVEVYSPPNFLIIHLDSIIGELYHYSIR